MKLRKHMDSKKGMKRNDFRTDRVDENCKNKKTSYTAGLCFAYRHKQQVIARLEKEGAKDMKLSTFVTIVHELGLDIDF